MRARIEPGTVREIGPAAFAFSRIAGRVTGTEPPAIFTTLGRAKRTYWGWLGFAATLMPFGSLHRRESEMVILRVACRRDSDYEWAHHARIGRRVGLSEAQVEDLRSTTPGALWDERELAMLTATDELLATSDLSDGTWARLREQLSERECVELLLLIGQYSMLATTLSTLRLRPDEPRGAAG